MRPLNVQPNKCVFCGKQLRKKTRYGTCTKCLLLLTRISKSVKGEKVTEIFENVNVEIKKEIEKNVESYYKFVSWTIDELLEELYGPMEYNITMRNLIISRKKRILKKHGSEMVNLSKFIEKEFKKELKKSNVKV